MFTWLRSSRTRILLTLELAVVLPAAALIVVNILYVNSIHRDKTVEAAIQRDFQQMLAISEKKSTHRLYGMLDKIRSRFPAAADEITLETFVMQHPDVAHAFTFEQPGHRLVLVSQPSRMCNEEFRDENKRVFGWLHSINRTDIEHVLREARASEAGPFYLKSSWGEPQKGKPARYQLIAFFPLPGLPADRAALGGVVISADYFQERFFPELLNEMVTRNASSGHSRQLAMMVRPNKEASPIAASTSWVAGPAEVERRLQEPFFGLSMGIKYRDTTLEAINQHFVYFGLAILAVLAVLLGGGIYLTHRNVAKEMELARLKSDFVSNVSHELRTPLSLIRLYAETLELGRLSSQGKYQEYYTIIRKESERLTALINNILDFSRIEAGRKEYDFRETDLAGLVRNTVDAYRYQIEQQGFVLEENIAGDLPPVRVDREAMARSVVNLVNNALKYSPAEKYLGLNVYCLNHAVRLEVVDHGIGIPRAEQQKIFQPFYRVGDPLVHNTKGTGLGLSLVRHIALAHGGDVTVESAPGKGSKFIMSLPAADAAAEAAPPATQESAATAPGPGRQAVNRGIRHEQDANPDCGR